jgi:acyl-coenzyme A thioesterase PaaI-like protein
VHSTDEVIIANISLGNRLNGHTGIVHGGILALLLDDLMGFGFHVKRITCEKQEGRKIYFLAQVTSPDSTVLYCEASSLYIIPKDQLSPTEQPSVFDKLKQFVGL